MNNLIKKIKGNELLSKSSSAFVFKIIGSFLGYFFLLLVTRNSGPEAWGIFTLCFAVLNITSVFSRLGIDTVLVKFVSLSKNKISEIKGVYLNGLTIVFLSSVLFSFLLYYFSATIADLVFHKQYLETYFKIIALALIPFSIIHVNVQTFRGLKKINHFAFFQHMSKFLFAIIFFIILYYYSDFDRFSVSVQAFTIAIILVMILSLVSLFKNFKVVNPIRVFSCKEIIKTSFPMMLSSSILLFMAWTDSIMIGIFMKEFDVGIYNVALKLAMTTGIILGAVNSILAPKISETFNNNRMDEFKRLIKYSTRVIFFSSLPFLILLFAFPEFLLSFFGDEFIIAKQTLFILLIGQFFNVMSGSVGYILQMTGKEKIYQNILFISLILNVIINIFLIPRIGVEGAAIASALSMLFWNLSSVFYIYKKYNVLTFVTI